MSKSKMRIGSILLVVAMLMTLLPVGVFAAEGDSIIEVKGTGYTDWKAAVEAAKQADNADIILLGELTLGMDDLQSLTALKSKVIIKAGASLSLPNNLGGTEAWFGGEDARMNIEQGSITLSGINDLTNGNCIWKLSENAIVSVPEGKTAFLQFAGSDTQTYGVKLEIASGAVLTVNGELKGVSGKGTAGSSVAVNGTLLVNGTMSVAKKATASIESTGKLEVASGATLKVTANTDANNVTLVQGGQFVAAAGATVGTTDSYLKSSKGGNIVTYTDENGNQIVENSGPIAAPEAKIGNEFYENLDGQDGALDKATDNATVILLKDASIADGTAGNTIKANVTLVVPSNKKLTIDAKGANFLTSQGVLQINAGGSFVLPNSTGQPETFVGAASDGNARLQLAKGSLQFNMGEKALTLTAGSEATVPTGKTTFLLMGLGDGTDADKNKTALNATIETGAKVTVATGGILKAISGNGEIGSQVTVKGILNVQGSMLVADKAQIILAQGGIMEVRNGAELTGATAVSGKVYVFDSATTTNSKLNLNIGGEVYAETSELANDIVNASIGILSKQTGSYAHDTATFQHQYSVIIPDDGGSTTTPTSYGITVSTAENGTVKSSNSSAAKDATVTITVTPNEGYVLDTLTVTDKDNNTVALTKVSDTQYTFKMPASAVTVKATFKKDEGTQPAALPFNDVSESEWFYEAVKYVYDKGMMNGVSDTSFAPYSNLTRGMIAQVLYNLEGKPAVSGSAYTDVAADQWYNDAVNWAAQKGIVTGYGDGTFGPMDNITREQMAAILYRYAQYKGYDVSAKGDLTAFTDGNTVSDWAKDAMSWAVGTALFNGKGDGILDPTTTATRAEVAKILMTYCENVAK